MSVRFKFRSSLGFDSLDLGGRPSIPVGDLRARILEQKNLEVCGDFRLVIFDASTGEGMEDVPALRVFFLIISLSLICPFSRMILRASFVRIQVQLMRMKMI